MFCLVSFSKTPYDINNARFGLIVPKTGWGDVEEVEAIVDYSTQYRAEGLQWMITKGTKDHQGLIGKHVVIAWYEK